MVACRRLYPEEVQQPFRNGDAVCCLRHDMNGSAPLNAFRLIK